MFRRSSGLSAGKYPVPSLDLNYAKTGALSGTETFTRASSAWAFNSSGVLAQHAANLPRFDYDPVTLQPKGLLIEEQRTNLNTYSGDLSTWGTQSGIISYTTAAGTAPDGTTSAVRVNVVTVAGNLSPNKSITGLAAGTVYAFTIFAKRGNSDWVRIRVNSGADVLNAWFNVATGMAGAASSPGLILTTFNSIAPVSVGNGWCRIGILLATTQTSIGLVVQPTTGNNVSTCPDAGTLLFWGAQLEAGPFPTSYIPTTSATATRAADVCTVPMSALGYSASEGTLFAEYANSGNVSGNIVYLSGTGTDMRISRLDAATSRFLVRNGSPQVVQADLSVAQTANPVTANPVRVAAAWANNDFRLAAAGILSAADTSGTVPVLTSFAIGSTGGSGWLNGCIRRIAFYSRRLDNAILGRMTS